MHKLKHIAFDAIGIILILVSPLLGWLPGPGGIPIFLAGLGFLSIHHTWAKRLMRYIKKNGLKLSEQIFREHPGLQALYDVASFMLFAGGLYLITTYTKNLTLSIAVISIFTAITIFLGNRKRIEWFQKRINKIFKR